MCTRATAEYRLWETGIKRKRFKTEQVILSFLNLSSVIGFWIFRFSGYRAERAPGLSFRAVQFPLRLFAQLLF
jgi:hypothetical protein